MKKILILVATLVVCLNFLFSCSSSHSSKDTDILPYSDFDDIETTYDDSDSQSSEIVDDYGDQDSEIVDDSDEMSDADTDYDTEEDFDDEEEEDEEIDDTDRINGYKRCYDEIPDEPYEGLFASSKLESQIKQDLGYDKDHELTEEDLEKITEIKLSVKDIRGVEKLVNLESVTISTGKIYDYTPLSNLEKLKKLKINATSMTCLDGSFSFLTNLETLEIEETKLKDVSPIEKLVNLKTFELCENYQIEFLPKHLGDLQKLEYLALSYNSIKNVKPVRSLTNLKNLYFHYNNVEDISPIKDLVNLIEFGAQGNQIKDISAVTKLVNLTWLGLNQNQIEAIPKDFVNLKKLQTCELNYNNISNLPDLKGLDSLDDMRLVGNNLNDEDFVKLDGLAHVKFLAIALNNITKVPIMKNLKSLQELYLNYNSITDLSGFADNDSFPALKSVYLGSNKIENAEALRKRKGLNRLSIGKNCITDLSPLEELKERGTYISGMNEQLENCGDK